MPQRLIGRSAVVTGAAQGIGRATAIRLAAEGARVLAVDLNLAGAEETAAAVSAAGGEAHARRIDVTDASAVEAMIGAAGDLFGRLDVLHNNAGGTDRALDRDVVSIPLAEWDRILRWNLTSAMLGCKYAIPLMIAGGGGSIVNMCSAAGLSGDFLYVAYSAAKAGIISLTRSVATAHGSQGIRCNAIAPGLTVTEATRSGRDGSAFARKQRHYLTPYLGRPEDQAAMVAFLASDDARFVTGQTIAVDGGLLSHTPAADHYTEPGV